MVTLVGRICYEPFVKRFGIHEDLRQNGIQEIEWLEIPSSVRNVGDLIHLVCGAFGIDQHIRISYMDSVLSADLTVDVLRTGSVFDIIHVVPTIVTTGQSIDLEECSLFSSSGIGSSLPSSENSNLGNGTEVIEMEVLDMVMDEIKGPDEQTPENRTFMIDTNPNMDKDASPAILFNLVDDPSSTPRGTEDQNEKVVSTPISNFTTLNAPNISPITRPHEATTFVQEDLEVSAAEPTASESDKVSKLARKLYFSEDEWPEGLKSSKISKSSNEEETLF